MQLKTKAIASILFFILRKEMQKLLQKLEKYILMEL